MQPGSVIVDLAGEQGGNCELSVPGETVVRNRVTIIAPLHISSELAFHASQMYAKNVSALVTLLAPKGTLDLESQGRHHRRRLRHREWRDQTRANA